MLFMSCVVVMLSGLFIAALWSPAGKGLTSWFLFVMSNCDVVTFPCGILGQVWYLIVLIPDLCRLSYFVLSLLSVTFHLAVGICCLPKYLFTGIQSTFRLVFSV